MRRIILIKHAKAQPVEGSSPETWPLSEAGKEAARQLAQKIESHRPAAIVSSPEPKALETAQILGELLQVPVKTHRDLEEHDRVNMPLLQTREFISLMALLFKQPNKVVLGNETAKAALWRMESAVDEILKEHPEQNVAIVSHGTVLALWLAKKLEMDGFPIWREMSQPAYVVVEEQEMKVVERVDRI